MLAGPEKNVKGGFYKIPRKLFFGAVGAVARGPDGRKKSAGHWFWLNFPRFYDFFNHL
jgi:hypothetical protein